MANTEDIKAFVAKPLKKDLVVPSSLTSLNRIGESVNLLQNALAYLDYQIDKEEFEKRRFGKTTFAALRKFQETEGLEVHGKYDSQTRRKLTTLLRKRKSSLRARSYTHIVCGSVRNNSGKAIPDATVTVSYSYNSKSVRATQKVLSSGFYRITFRGPVTASGQKVESFYADVEVRSSDGAVLWQKKIAIKRPRTWVNFGKFYGPSEYEQVYEKLDSMFGKDEFNAIFVPFEKISIPNIVSSSGIDKICISAFAVSWRIYDAMQRFKLLDDSVGPDIIYGLVRNSIPSDAGNALLGDAEKVGDIADKNNSLLLEKLFSYSDDDIHDALANAIRSNTISHDHETRIDGIIKSLSARRGEYYLYHFIPYGKDVTLSVILEKAGISGKKCLELAHVLAADGFIDDRFVDDCRSLLTEKQHYALERSVYVFYAVGFSKTDADIAFSLLTGWHVSKMVTFEQEWAGMKGVDSNQAKDLLKDLFPGEWFVCYLDHVFGNGKDDLGSTITYLMDSMFINDPGKRFIFTDMKMTDSYDFSKKKQTEKNEVISDNVRILQRLYKISRKPEVAADFINKGITSAVSAYYKIKNGEIHPDAEVESAIEDIYWKAVNLYNDIQDVSRNSSKIFYSNSANLRSLFGSVDAYVYEECLTLLDTPAYLADILRFLGKMECDNGATAYDILMKKRPDIARIKLNIDNSNILVPQIDLTCEILEDRVYSVNWDKMQTSETSDGLLGIPQFIDKRAYRILDSSGATSYHPYFSLPQAQTRALLDVMGVPRYKLMELFGAPEQKVAGEYFGFSVKELAFLDETGTSTWSQYLDISSKNSTFTMYVSRFMCCAGLEYDEALDIFKAIGINCSNADPDGSGFPDIEKQTVWFRKKKETLARLQRLVMIYKRTGIAPDRIIELARATQTSGALDSKLLVALMNIKRAGEEEGEDILDDFFTGSELDAVLSVSSASIDDKAGVDAPAETTDNAGTTIITPLGSIDYRQADEPVAEMEGKAAENDADAAAQAAVITKDNACEAVAIEKGTEATKLEYAFKKLKLGSYEKDEDVVSILRSIANLDSCLELSPEEFKFVIDRYKTPQSWTKDILRDMACIIRFNKTYSISGKEPIVAVKALTASQCRFAETLKLYLDLIGATDQSVIERWAMPGDYNNELDIYESILKLMKQTPERSCLIKKAMDIVRVEKRDALIGYILAKKENWGKSADDLYNDLLVDVKMGPEQSTTRITLATSSVQLFVQRCLLNLESGITIDAAALKDTTSQNSWAQWSWMKNYRVWEANRKIFLFPENWIDAELRDDATPEFQNFINEISQGEATEDNMEDAVSNYLYALDDISNLEVCGLYRQKEECTDMVHIIARTRNSAPKYYYRCFDNKYEEWSPWELIDTEIEGDQIVPVVYNRRLYIFWLVFVQKALKLKRLPSNSSCDNETDAPEPANYYEIQLAWTYRKGNEWKPQTIGRQKLIHPWERPRSCYDMKPYIDSRNRLHLDIYLSKCPEFNDKGIPDRTFDYYPEFECRYTTNRTGNNDKPWHSSTFVFEGEITHILLKNLYHNNISSYGFVHNNFGEDGAAIEPMGEDESGSALLLPDGMDFRNGRLCDSSLSRHALAVLEIIPELMEDQWIEDQVVEALKNQLKWAGNKQERILYATLREYRKFIAGKSRVSRVLFNQAKSPFQLVMSQQNLQMNAMQKKAMMFYQDKNRSFCIVTENVAKTVKDNFDFKGFDMPAYRTGTCNYSASLFYHPYVKAYVKAIRSYGLDGLYDRKLQICPWALDVIERHDGEIIADYMPTDAIINHPVEETEFSLKSAYGLYNWELFFHIPLTAACKLSANKQYEDAMKWFHYIFNPMDYSKQSGTADNTERFWVTRPFYENALREKQAGSREERIECILMNLTDNNAQLTAWKNNPYKPHIVAKYRTVAYQKAVVMKYIENLIAWADDKFREDTMESINEATLLYVLAYEILGKRPQKVPAPDIHEEDLCYDELKSGIDALGNSKKAFDRADLLIYAESLLDPKTIDSTVPSVRKEVPTLDVFYFDVPENSNLEGYWDTVEDRLYKIRASLNIDGVFRSLDIKAPEIDPGALVFAAANGGDISAIANSGSKKRPLYRFRTTIQLAQQLCAEVKSLGDKLLSVLEKKDAEELSVMRSTYEHNLLVAQTTVRKKEIEVMKLNIKSLEYNLEKAVKNQEYYSEIELISTKEQAALELGNKSLYKRNAAEPINAAASVLMSVGNITTGAEGVGSSPVCTYTISFQGIGQALSLVANGLEMAAGIQDRMAGIISTNASYERRSNEWKQQAILAEKEVLALNEQISSAQVQLEIAEKQLEIHKQTIDQSAATLAAMKGKFTNEKLYNWMQTEICKVYYGAFNMTYELAQEAERCYELELGEVAGIIKTGSWTSAKKGLLAGDLLMQQILQLEKKYYQSNSRNLEIIKHIPLSELPSGDGGAYGSALLDLIYDGNCTVKLPEWLYDMDYPKHYMRRIKSVSLSIPCIIGPNSSVNCTLRLLRDGTRLATGGKDAVELSSSLSSSSIATSSGINDSGMFEVNFNDERYLPFEGFGAISEWNISLPKENNFFDRTSISDVILNVCYTSREDNSIEASHGKESKGLVKVISMKHDFGAEWRKLTSGEREVSVTIPENIYPYLMRSGEKSLTSVWIESLKSKKSQEKKLTGSTEITASLNDGIIFINVKSPQVLENATDMKIVVESALK